MRNVSCLQSRKVGTWLSCSLIRQPYIPLPPPSALHLFSTQAIIYHADTKETPNVLERLHNVHAPPTTPGDYFTQAAVDPFAPVRIALKGPPQDLVHFLNLIPSEAFSDEKIIWRYGILFDLLRRPADQASLLRLTPIIFRFIQETNIHPGVKIAGALLRQIRLLRILPLMSTLVDAIATKIKMGVDQGEIHHNRAMGMIVPLLVELKRFRFSSKFTKTNELTSGNHVPPYIDTQVYRLATLAISIAESTPSSSSTTPIISSDIRKELFGKALLTSQLRQLLLGHIPREEITAQEWRACAYHVIKEGGGDAEKRARSYLLFARKASTLRVPRTKSSIESIEARDEKWIDDDSLGKASVLKARAPFDWSVTTDIDRITLARCGETAHSVFRTLQPYLEHPISDTDGTHNHNPDIPVVGSYAWSILLQRLSKSSNTSSTELLDLAHDLTPNLVVPHIMTPIITGLAARGDMEQAWALWTDLADQEKEGKSPGRFVDRYLLAAVTPICASLHGPDAAVELVDDWATRANGTSKGWKHSISLDPVNLLALLNPYVKLGRPSVPLRLIEAALPRWGIWPDHISLNLVLDCCRFASLTSGTEETSIQSRLQDVLGEFRMFKPKDETSRLGEIIRPEEYAGQGNGGTHHILLDPQGATWRDMMDDTRPWQFARQIFRDVIFGNWPYLQNIRSPLLFGTFGSLDSILNPPSPPGDRFPLPAARYTHILPTSSTFQSYITLLGYYRQTEEIPTALAWARELGIEPNWKSMISALAFIGDVEGPRRRVSGWYNDGGAAYVRDEEVLRRWLEHWVKGDVPTEGDVAGFVKTVQDKGGRMTARSGWGQSE